MENQKGKQVLKGAQVSNVGGVKNVWLEDNGGVFDRHAGCLFML